MIVLLETFTSILSIMLMVWLTRWVLGGRPSATSFKNKEKQSSSITPTYGDKSYRSSQKNLFILEQRINELEDKNSSLKEDLKTYKEDAETLAKANIKLLRSSAYSYLDNPTYSADFFMELHSYPSNDIFDDFSSRRKKLRRPKVRVKK